MKNNYELKYLKYKKKYLQLKGGRESTNPFILSILPKELHERIEKTQPFTNKNFSLVKELVPYIQTSRTQLDSILDNSDIAANIIENLELQDREYYILFIRYIYVQDKDKDLYNDIVKKLEDTMKNLFNEIYKLIETTTFDIIDYNSFHENISLTLYNNETFIDFCKKYNLNYNSLLQLSLQIYTYFIYNWGPDREGIDNDFRSAMTKFYEESLDKNKKTIIVFIYKIVLYLVLIHYNSNNILKYENRYDIGTFRFITTGCHYEFINFDTLKQNNMIIFEELPSTIVTDFVKHKYVFLDGGVKKLFEN
jgi:hypothetical protein